LPSSDVKQFAGLALAASVKQHAAMTARSRFLAPACRLPISISRAIATHIIQTNIGISNIDILNAREGKYCWHDAWFICQLAVQSFLAE